ncbi:MAG TPA: LysR substrate-binding domain-containing protein [Pirellulales bacterium]|jgi:LysR family hydrogen peroxide-inducible transcriptional activator|nr:LysR substrate-binding domain-containing protein [Pirellulales bacterium]
MELHQLRYFVAVAELSSFTRAAEKCLVAQPSLSQQIIKLEKELRQPLFERLGRTIRLTDAGRILYSQAVAILGSIDEVRTRILGPHDLPRGPVRVGAIPTIAPYLLPPLLRAFGRQHPGGSVVLQENLTDFTIRGCLEGELDLGIIATPLKNEHLLSEPLFTEELLLALPPRHPLTKKRTLSLEKVAGEPFVLMDEVHCLGEQIVGFCSQQGCLPIVHCRSVQLLTIQELVASGHGVSLIPAMARTLDRGRRCEYRSLDAPRPTRTIRLIWHKDRYQSSLVKAFVELLRASAPGKKGHR